MKALRIAEQNDRAIDTHWKSNPAKGMALYHAIRRFERFQEEPPPEEVSPEEWREIKADQLKVKLRADNGAGGGRPKGAPIQPNKNPTQTECKPNPNRTRTETEPNNGQDTEEEKDRLSLPSVLKGGKEGVSGDSPSPPARSRSRFVPPTLDEIKTFWATGGKDGGPLPGDAEDFFDYYESVGWVTKGGRPIKDWKATARRWGRNQKNFAPNGSAPPSLPEPDPYEYRGPLSPEEQWGDPSALPSSDSDAAAPSHDEGGVS